MPAYSVDVQHLCVADTGTHRVASDRLHLCVAVQQDLMKTAKIVLQCGSAGLGGI